MYSLRRVQNQYHRPGEISSFLAIGHLLVLTEGNIPYHMKIIVKCTLLFVFYWPVVNFCGFEYHFIFRMQQMFAISNFHLLSPVDKSESSKVFFPFNSKHYFLTSMPKWAFHTNCFKRNEINMRLCNSFKKIIIFTSTRAELVEVLPARL